MPVEIEIKLKVDHLAPVRDRLRAVGATLAGEAMETNVFFDTPERTLLSQDCGLRLRTSHPVGVSKAAAAAADEKRRVTFKGPREEGAVKKREEIEVGVDDAGAVTALIERFGYVAQLTFEKRRETWRLEGSTIELDTLPELGSYVEIESPSEEQVLEIRKRLGLEHVEPVAPTYADLVSHHLTDRGAQEKRLRFS
jgi:predicted adenylyl cyclase CyaB